MVDLEARQIRVQNNNMKNFINSGRLCPETVVSNYRESPNQRLFNLDFP